MDRNAALTRANQLLLIRRPDEAAEVVGNALLSDPNDSALLAMMAKCELSAGRAWPATELAQRALHRDPSDQFARQLLAMGLVRTLRIGQGLEHSRSTVSTNPNDAGVQKQHARVCLEAAGRGLWYRRKGVLEEARESIHEAIRMDPNDPGVFVVASNVHGCLKDAEAAVRFAQRAVELDPASPDAHLSLAAALKQTGDTTTAASHALQAGRLDPRNNVVAFLSSLYSPRILIPFLAWLGSFRLVLKLGFDGTSFVDYAVFYLLTAGLVVWIAIDWRRRRATRDPEVAATIRRHRKLDRPSLRACVFSAVFCAAFLFYFLLMIVVVISRLPSMGLQVIAVFVVPVPAVIAGIKVGRRVVGP